MSRTRRWGQCIRCQAHAELVDGNKCSSCKSLLQALKQSEPMKQAREGREALKALDAQARRNSRMLKGWM